MPSLIDEIRSSGEFSGRFQTMLDDMAERLAAGKYDAVTACDLFSSMAELNGGRPGQSRTLAYVPDGRSPLGISAQSCLDGRYTSLLLTGDDIVVGDEVDAAMAATLELLEGAPPPRRT